MLAIMLLMVAGARSWSAHSGKLSEQPSKTLALDHQKGLKGQPAQGDEAKISTLSLDAVITPAISFDFAHYFYFLPQAAWQVLFTKAAVQVTVKESFFFLSNFHRIFGRFIVTNAP